MLYKICDTVAVTGEERLHLIYPLTPPQLYFTWSPLHPRFRKQALNLASICTPRQFIQIQIVPDCFAIWLGKMDLG